MADWISASENWRRNVDDVIFSANISDFYVAG